MAIEKALSTPYSTQATYWRITTVNMSVSNMKCQLFLSGYLNEESRLNGDNPIVTENFMVKDLNFDKYYGIETLNILNNNPVEQGYLYLKENIEKFRNAIDV